MVAGETTSQVSALLERFERFCLECWGQTGFGEVSIRSQPVGKRGAIAVDVGGTTFVRYIVNKDDIRAEEQASWLYDRSNRSIQEFFRCVKSLLLNCWNVSGHGTVVVRSELASRDPRQIAVTVLGSTHYRFNIRAQDIDHA